MIGMTKAKIKVLDGMNKILMATAYIGSDGVPCMFNPADFTIQRGVNYAQHKVPGLDRPILQYISGEADVMSFSLIFDMYSATPDTYRIDAAASGVMPDPAKLDVREYTDAFMKLTMVDSDTHAPNQIEFKWGAISFKGYVQSVSQKFTMFSMKGTPTRATVDLQLISVSEQNFVRNSPDRTKARTITESDRLYMFAYAEYGECGEWRRIAVENNIDNPRTLEPGTNIVIPPIL